MNSILDGLLVGAALLASVVYAVAKLGPKLWGKRNQGACGGCDNCGAESSSTPQSSAEIKVPVAKIGRRA